MEGFFYGDFFVVASFFSSKRAKYAFICMQSFWLLVYLYLKNIF